MGAGRQTCPARAKSVPFDEVGAGGIRLHEVEPAGGRHVGDAVAQRVEGDGTAADDLIVTARGQIFSVEQDSEPTADGIDREPRTPGAVIPNAQDVGAIGPPRSEPPPGPLTILVADGEETHRVTRLRGDIDDDGAHPSHATRAATVSAACLPTAAPTWKTGAMFIVVGVTGGIAAYKTVGLVRLLVKAGHDVHVIPTDDALRFVGSPTWEAISRNPVTTSVHDDVARVRHVALGQSADLVIVAPATANTLAAMTAGLASDLLGTTLLATTAPVVVAPAMHTEMWRHPATTHNMEVLRARGVHVVGPADGALTGGDSGPGRMSEPEEIVAAALALVARPRDLDGVSIVVSAGGTREPIDPVRFLGNRSSGRQGVAIARAAADRGADVTLVAAHLDADVHPDPRVEVIAVGTADELGRAMDATAPDADVVIMAAAVADYSVASVSEHKLRKQETRDGLTLELVENRDIVAGLVASRRGGQTIVAFAAETVRDDDELLERARAKAARKGVDLLAANAVGWTRGFESTDNALMIVGRDGEVVATASGSKDETAHALLDAVLAARST